MRTKKAVVGGPWKGPGGPRVLVENPDLGVGYSFERLLIEQGYGVAVCEGPDCWKARRCPLVATGECDLAANADVIVHSLNPNRPEHAEVLQALRSRYPTAPVVTEIAEPAMAHHRELLRGCSVLRFPATRTSLTRAVHAAAATHKGGRVHRRRARWEPSASALAEAGVVPTIVVRVAGPVTTTERTYAEQNVADALRVVAPALVPSASLELRAETDPGWNRPALAKATIDVNGRPVRVHADATTMFVAIDVLVARLQRRLEDLG